MKFCYDQGCNDIGVLIATKWRHYLFHLQQYFSALGTVRPKSFTRAFSSNSCLMFVRFISGICKSVIEICQDEVFMVKKKTVKNGQYWCSAVFFRGGEMGRRREKNFLGICSIWWREEEGKISRRICLSYTRHVTYLNLIGQTNASIESVPGTSQPQRNITCVPRLDINYIMSRHNVRFYSEPCFHVKYDLKWPT